MSKKKAIDLRRMTPLIERQRALWNHAEGIGIARSRKEPLPDDVSAWLERALQNIACGMDANEAFGVLPEKRGVRRDSFLRAMQRSMANGFIAAATEKTDPPSEATTTKEAIDTISSALVGTKRSTVKKNWNKASTDRKPTFSLGKK